MQCSWIKWLSIIKMPFDTKLIFRFTAFSRKYQHGFRGSCQAVLKFMMKMKKPQIVNTPEKNHLLRRGRELRSTSY